MAVTGVSQAVAVATVPYWQSAHSLMRDVTVSGSSIVQRPAAGTFEPLRTRVKPQVFGPIIVSKTTGGGEFCNRQKKHLVDVAPMTVLLCCVGVSRVSAIAERRRVGNSCHFQDKGRHRCVTLIQLPIQVHSSC